MATAASRMAVKADTVMEMLEMLIEQEIKDDWFDIGTENGGRWNKFQVSMITCSTFLCGWLVKLSFYSLRGIYFKKWPTQNVEWNDKITCFSNSIINVTCDSSLGATWTDRTIRQVKKRRSICHNIHVHCVKGSRLIYLSWCFIHCAYWYYCTSNLTAS